MSCRVYGNKVNKKWILNIKEKNSEVIKAVRLKVKFWRIHWLEYMRLKGEILANTINKNLERKAFIQQFNSIKNISWSFGCSHQQMSKIWILNLSDLIFSLLGFRLYCLQKWYLISFFRNISQYFPYFMIHNNSQIFKIIPVRRQIMRIS